MHHFGKFSISLVFSFEINHFDSFDQIWFETDEWSQTSWLLLLNLQKLIKDVGKKSKS